MIQFVKSPRASEPDSICNESTGDHALDMTMQQCAAEKYNGILNETKIIRHKLETMAK